MKEEILSIFDELISRYEGSGIMGLHENLVRAKDQAKKYFAGDLPVKQFLFVEDGSVDTDELYEILERKNPEIQLVVYRQGGIRPELVEVKK